MRILPLVLHSAARLPALTGLFSDTLSVASMVVTQGGKTVLTTTQPHGFDPAKLVPLSVVDADTPNAITAAVVVGGQVQLTMAHQHDIAGQQYVSVRLAGFTNPAMNGVTQLVSVDGPNAITVLPPSTVSSVTLTGSEVLLERLETGIIGWHAMTVTGDTTVEFDTPAEVERSFTVANPRVVGTARIGGSMNLATAQKQYVRGYAKGATSYSDDELAKAWMFICPWQSMRISKDRNSQSDAIVERRSSSDYRRMLVDGYYVYVAIAAESSGGGVIPSDLANGEILAAVLRTFDGLSLPSREFAVGDMFMHTVVEHGQALGEYDGATYWHGYSVEVPTMLTEWDSIRPFEWSRINETEMTAASGIGPGSLGGALIETPITPEGSLKFRGITFGPAPDGGIRHDNAPGPLTAVITID